MNKALPFINTTLGLSICFVLLGRWCLCYGQFAVKSIVTDAQRTHTHTHTHDMVSQLPFPAGKRRTASKNVDVSGEGIELFTPLQLSTKIAFNNRSSDWRAMLRLLFFFHRRRLALTKPCVVIPCVFRSISETGVKFVYCCSSRPLNQNQLIGQYIHDSSQKHCLLTG